MDNIKVSIIMPSLDVAEYIRESLESAINQTLKEIEIICVDAGSTDGTVEIIKEFVKRDKRVRLINSPVKSYGYQMNLGISQAQGEYIGIIETDDYVKPEMYEELYIIAEKEQVDFVKADFYHFTIEKNTVKQSYVKLGPDNYYGRVINPAEEQKVFRLFMNTWSGIYRRSFIEDNNIKHNETPGAAYQDNGFFFQTFCCAKKIYFLHKAYYMYRQDNFNSSIFNPNRLPRVIIEFEYIYNWLKGNNFLMIFKGPFAAKKYIGLIVGIYAAPDNKKKEYSYISAKEMAKHINNGEYDEKYFNDNEWRQVCLLINNTEKFYEEVEIKSVKRELEDKKKKLQASSSIEDILKYPISFLEDYEAFYDKLRGEKIYKDIEKIFIEELLSSCAYILGIVKNDDARIKIYKKLLEFPITRIGISNYPLDYFKNKRDAIQILGSKYVVEWHEKFCKTKSDSCRVLIDNRKDNNVLVSVIIPVYNTALYLKECLESICRQTLAQIEIICINDGSTDESLDILQKYAKEDNRIIVCTQENCGQASARNKGAVQAHGKYLYFMDSDDVLELSALEVLYERAEADNVDVIYFDGDSFTKDQGLEKLSARYTEKYTRNFNYDGIQEGHTLLSKMVQHEEYQVSPCLQFINRGHYIRNKLSFCEGIIHEDDLFNYKCMLCARTVEHIPLCLFHRRVRPDSTMTKKISFADAYGYFICHLKMSQFYNEQDLCRIDDAMLYWPVKKTLNLSRIKYQQLSLEEKQTIFALSCNQRQLFEAYVIDVCNEKMKARNLQASAEYAKKELKDTKKKLKATLSREESLKKSSSFRIGRAMTWVPRKILGGARCFKEHGPVYTLKRFFWHIAH